MPGPLAVVAPSNRGDRGRRWGVIALCATLPLGCVSVPPKPRPDLAATAHSFEQRRLEGLYPGEASPTSGWDRAQWLNAALILNPDLAEARAKAMSVAAAERTAAQRPNPTLNLFGEYIAAAAGGVGWLYGLSLDFLLQRPGERDRAKATAALQTQAAQSDVAEAIWTVRAQVHQALLDAVYANAQIELLQQLLDNRQGQLSSAEARARVGEISFSEVPTATLELAAAQQRLERARARDIDARSRLAAAVGVPAAALEQVPLRWSGWADIDALSPTLSTERRAEALIGRPEVVRTLHEYDIADNAVRSELARRWPEFHLVPGYAWDKGGVRENQLNETLRDNEIGLSGELPLFNRNEGPIGEAVARRELAGKHLEAVQADLFEQMERAERAWPHARKAWQNAASAAITAQQQNQLQQRALKEGASDRSSALTAAGAATEARLLSLDAAYEAQEAFAELESAYRRPLDGPECDLPMSWRTE
jgi:cobalt-zinc-cadmium efflux system outer membrane protein